MQSGEPAGWYADPTSRHAQRYFDGATWTDQVADAQGAQSTDPLTGQVPRAPALAATKRGRTPLLLVAFVAVALAALAVGFLVAPGDDDDTVEESTDATATTPTTESEETTTTRRSTTSTTEPGIDDPTDVVGSSVAVALNDLRDAGITATQVEVIDETVPDGQVVQAQEQPDGSVVLTVARPAVTRFLEVLPRVQEGGDTVIEGPTFDVSGVTYSHGVSIAGLFCRPAFIEYDLGRDFRRFVATAGLLDTVRAEARGRVEISVDGQIVSTNDLGLGDTLAVDIDVTGALRLRVSVTPLVDEICAATGLGDARLLGVPSEVPPEPEN